MEESEINKINKKNLNLIKFYLKLFKIWRIV